MLADELACEAKAGSSGVRPRAWEQLRSALTAAPGTDCMSFQAQARPPGLRGPVFLTSGQHPHSLEAVLLGW